ncbi:MAG: hypothetical protein WBN57_08405 [Gammaproteobacteria bacterium]
MNRTIMNTVPGLLLVMLAGAGYSMAVSADAAGDCRQEVLDYDIPAEQSDDYINGCLASRGELIVENAAEVDYVPTAEPDTIEGDADAAQ